MHMHDNNTVCFWPDLDRSNQFTDIKKKVNIEYCDNSVANSFTMEKYRANVNNSVLELI